MRAAYRMALLLAAGLTLGGCVRYYKVGDVRARLAEGRRTFDDALGKVQQDLGRKRRACQQRGQTGGEAAGLLQTMTARAEELRRHRRTYDELAREFDRLARGKRRIRSDRPEWEPVQDLRSRAERLLEQAKAAGNAYRDATNQLAALLSGR